MIHIEKIVCILKKKSTGYPFASMDNSSLHLKTKSFKNHLRLYLPVHQTVQQNFLHTSFPSKVSWLAIRDTIFFSVGSSHDRTCAWYLVCSDLGSKERKGLFSHTFNWFSFQLLIPIFESCATISADFTCTVQSSPFIGIKLVQVLIISWIFIAGFIPAEFIIALSFASCCGLILLYIYFVKAPSVAFFGWVEQDQSGFNQ